MNNTPIGIKLNLTSLTEASTLDAIIQSLATYHKGCYIVGKDTDMSINKEPHYHVHFWAPKKVTKNALKTFRCELGKKFPTLTRSDKLYTGQDLPNADPLRWFAYAIKEEFIHQQGLDDKLDTIKGLALVEREFKKCKLVNSEKIVEKNNAKKELKDKLFDYIEQYHQIRPKEEKEWWEKYLSFEEYVCSHNHVCQAIISYYIQNDMFGHLSKTIIERYYKEYLAKRQNKDEVYLYEIIFSR